MRNTYFLILLFSINTIYGCSQETVRNIEWKTGDSKHLLIQFRGKEINDSVVTKDTTFTTQGDILVNEIADNCYFITFSTENKLIHLGSTFYPGLTDELSNSSSFRINLKIHKDSLSSLVLNKQEYQNILDKSRNEIVEVLKTKTPAKVEMATLKLDELLASLKQGDEAAHTMDLLLEAYKTKYSFTDTIFSCDSLANPFKLKNFNGAKLKTYVNKKKGSDSFDIIAERSFDFDEYKNMMSELSKISFSTIDKIAGNEITSQSTEQIDGMLNSFLSFCKFDASQSTIITQQPDSGWPDKLQKTTALKMCLANNTSEGLIDILIEIK